MPNNHNFSDNFSWAASGANLNREDRRKLMKQGNVDRCQHCGCFVSGKHRCVADIRGVGHETMKVVSAAKAEADRAAVYARNARDQVAAMQDEAQEMKATIQAHLAILEQVLEQTGIEDPQVRWHIERMQETLT